MKIWFKEWKKSKIVRDITIEDDSGDTRTHKVFSALERACREFDLPVPIWLDSTVAEFRRYGKARFTQDAFIEEIPFDALEIHVVDED